MVTARRLHGAVGVRFVPLLLAALLTWGCANQQPPYSPEEALGTFQIEDGFRVELFASEPDVVDPVAIEFDESGRIFVVENSGYPLDVEGRAGRIKLLTDTDGDGRPDRATLFADGLTLPTGVMAWKGGILVTDAPDVLFLADTDGDGRADVQRVVLTGFPFNNPQHTVSSPYYGLDNWIYLSHEGFSRSTVFGDKFGDPGSEIHFPGAPDSPRLAIERRSVRFRPETLQIEYLANPSQFGLTFDLWGRLFIHNNSRHLRHEVLSSRYLERNPQLRLVRPFEEMSDHGAPAPVFPITVNPRFELLTDAGQMTSACGLTVYLGGAFPTDFKDGSFVAEPAHNLVHRDIWEPNGATFKARRAHAGREFLASTDRWFRPVNLYIGPDGALYLLDYYREVIEHPEWTAAETYESPHLFDGNDRGRIYRIVPEDGLPSALGLSLRDASDAELVNKLADTNIWWRRMAQRLLVERRSGGSVVLLRAVVEERPSAVARLHALWTLDGMGRLDDDLISLALDDDEPGVRENAILMAEPRLRKSPTLIERILPLARDPDPRVRFQILLTLGEMDSAETRRIAEEAFFADIRDPWMRAAALTHSSMSPAGFLRNALRLSELSDRESAEHREIFEQLAALVGAAGSESEVADTVGQVARAGPERRWWLSALLNGMAVGISSRNAPLSMSSATSLKTLSDFAAQPETDLRGPAIRILEQIETPRLPPRTLTAALGRAQDPGLDPELRADSIRLLAIGPDPDERRFQLLVIPDEPEAVQAAAVRALARTDDTGLTTFLLAKWRELPPQARNAAGDILAQDDESLALVLNRLEEGDVEPWTVRGQLRRRLIMHDDAPLRERARLLITQPPEQRKQVLAQYRAALDQQGNSEAGRQVFERACSKCHAVDGVGKEVGPDLATVRTRPAEFILNDILLPNQSIEPRYESYVVETNDGRILEGVLGPPSPTVVTLRREEGEQDIISRTDIRGMRSAQLSAMPEDLENQITVEEMAHLIRFIQAPPWSK
ncbi:MAG: HEAT repeat domain-containing protein [Bryobacterales bacterium]|nr:HEAT repeat domain-containing protein [Bryobacterales bacterium]MDE0296867.1 HEAT repeat domain-containing protein [Bryobacterales bacterium]